MKAQTEIDEVLEQYIVFGQLEHPFNCARCGAGTDDKTQNFCWCTDRDSSSRASSPTWIDNVNYPRYVKAKAEASAKLQELMIKERIDGLNEDVSQFFREFDNIRLINQKDPYDLDTRAITRWWQKRIGTVKALSHIQEPSDG